MIKILTLKSSVSGEQGQSNKLVNQFIKQYAAKAQVELTSRDLSATELPHLSGAEMAAWMTEANERSEAQQQLAALSDGFIKELQQAEVIVIGMPMYNFGVPSTFKAWIDRIARAGITFKYTEQGPVGLLENKKVVVLAARGGMYQGTPADTQSQYLKNVLGFIGLTDVEFIYAEGLSLEAPEQRLAEAESAISALLEQKFV